jgi:hypothetical protein
VIPLGSLPAELPDGTRALWDALPERSFLSRLADGTGMHTRDRREDRRERDECTIRRVQAVRTLSELECQPDVAVATLRLAATDFAATRDVSEDDLARGVLIGRYDRCAEPISVTGISRVHLLIARLGTALVAIDTASTNGSELHRGGSFSITRLTENTVISLAGWAYVGWSMRPRGAA